MINAYKFYLSLGVLAVFRSSCRLWYSSCYSYRYFNRTRFDPFKAAVASLVANTVPTAFGAVGIPVSILAQNTGLDVLVLSKTIIIQLGLFNILLPFVIVAIAGGGIKAIKGVGFITLMCGISTLIPQYIVAANLGAELPAFAGSLVSLIVVIFLAKRMKTGHDKSKQPTKHSAKELLVASSIYLFTFIFILACSPLFPTIQTAVGTIATKIPFVLSDTQTEYQTIAWLSTPGVLIILASFVGGTIQGASLSTLFSVLVKTTIQLKNSIIAIMAIVAMATVMDFSGMIGSIAETLVNFTGAGFIFIAPVIGALGTFVTGSDTNSNVLFGKLQTSAAAKLHVDPFILAAANTSGATGGKMISPQKHRDRRFGDQNGWAKQCHYARNIKILYCLYHHSRCQNRHYLSPNELTIQDK